MPDEKKNVSKHVVTLDKRQTMAVTGILDVISFDEDTVICETELGMLILRGEGLHVARLNLDIGELEVSGELYSLTYEDTSGFSKGKPSFLGKLFK